MLLLLLILALVSPRVIFVQDLNRKNVKERRKNQEETRRGRETEVNADEDDEEEAIERFQEITWCRGMRPGEEGAGLC